MKRIVSLLLVSVMLVSLTACGGGGLKGKTLTLQEETFEGDDVMLEAVFTYPDSEDITTFEDEEEQGYKKIINEKENYEIDIGLFEDTTYDANANYDKEEEETYSEFKVGKYDAYGYESYGGYTVVIHLEEVSETTDRYINIDVNRADFSEDGLEGKAAYEENKVAKEIVNSLVYNGVVEVETTEESE